CDLEWSRGRSPPLVVCPELTTRFRPRLRLPRPAALLGEPEPLARVLADELLGLLPRDWIGNLLRRRLHQVRARAIERSGESAIHCQLAESHGVDHDPG